MLSVKFKKIFFCDIPENMNKEIQGLNKFKDEYNNWCFGNINQKHIVHLHPNNNYIDI